MHSFQRTTTTGLFLLASLFSQSGAAATPSAVAVPKLDPNQLLGTYSVIARYPISRQKSCLGNENILYALGDKDYSLQIVITCQMKNEYTNYWNAKGKFPKAGDGKIRLDTIWPFTTGYWVLALAPDYSYALLGDPNRKSLWIISRTHTLNPATLAQLESTAAAQGFNTANLVTIKQTD